jgi:hypothetical protein
MERRAELYGQSQSQLDFCMIVAYLNPYSTVLGTALAHSLPSMKDHMGSRVPFLSCLDMSSLMNLVSVSFSSCPVICVMPMLMYHGIDLEGKWGMRIESALAVTRVKTKGEFNGNIWLGFERLTCVPIQTRMVKEAMLSKEEKQWLKVRLRLLPVAHIL